MNIRPAQIQDANTISLLIKNLSRFFTIHPQGLGAEAFLQSVEPIAIETKISDASFSYFVAFSGSELAGLIALKINLICIIYLLRLSFKARIEPTNIAIGPTKYCIASL